MAAYVLEEEKIMKRMIREIVRSFFTLKGFKISATETERKEKEKKIQLHD